MKTKINSAKNIVNKAPKVAPKVKQVLTIKPTQTEEASEKMRVTFKQMGLKKDGGELSAQIVFETSAPENLAKQALGHFYAIIAKYKAANIKLFNFAYPIYLIIEKDGQKIDLSGLLSTEYLGLTQGLKLTWNNEGLKKFGRNVRIAIDAVNEDRMRIVENEYIVLSK
jgi:hypothetical protein